MRAITVVPNPFELVPYDADTIARLAAEAAALAGFPDDVSVTLEIDEVLPHPLTGTFVEVTPEAERAGGTAHLDVWMSGANFEDPKRPVKFQEELARAELVRAFLRAADRLRPEFAGAVGDEDLSDRQRAAWDVWTEGRAERLGVPGTRPRTFTERARRAQIVDAAIETIAELGYARASFAQIARRAALSSTGLISYHFAGKDELIAEVIASIYSTIGAFMALLPGGFLHEAAEARAAELVEAAEPAGSSGAAAGAAARAGVPAPTEGADAAGAASGVIVPASAGPVMVACSGADADAAGALGLAGFGAAVWPLLPGITDDPGLWERACERLAASGLRCLQALVPAFGAGDRRRLAQGLQEGAFEALFHRRHREPPPERDFARTAHRHGLAPFLPRPLPRPPLLRAENRRIAGLLALAAELWLRLGRPVEQAQSLFRAARWLDATSYDVDALNREGNLAVVTALDPLARRAVAEASGGGEPALVGELLAEYLE